jgi:hypothetical protein
MARIFRRGERALELSRSGDEWVLGFGGGMLKRPIQPGNGSIRSARCFLIGLV